MREKEEKPEWLKQINNITKESKEKITAYEEKLKELSFDKGPRLELKPSGAPSAGKSFWANQMERHYKDEIESEKTNSYNKCSDILKNVKEADREPHAGELKNELSAIRPNEIEPQHKEEEKNLDASQSYSQSRLDQFKEHSAQKPEIKTDTKETTNSLDNKEQKKEEPKPTPPAKEKSSPDKDRD